MTIRQGFNRLGVSVAIAFLGLAVVSLCFAGSNYLQYSSEVEQQLQKQMKGRATSPAAQEKIRAEVIATPGWQRFAQARYRSVDQALDLAGLCVLAAIISVIFWNAVGWIFARFETAEDSSAG